MIDLDFPLTIVPKVEDAIAASDKKAIQDLYDQLQEHFTALEKSGVKDSNGMEWFFSMVPTELLPN